MSTVAISYSDIKNASNEASAVARKLDSYAGALQSAVYKKLNNYGGNWTANLTSAKSSTNGKIQDLHNEADRYRAYSANLSDLKSVCESTDVAVKDKVSSLTASFKEAHGIRNSQAENFISYLFTSAGNSTSFGRWLGGKSDEWGASRSDLKSQIKLWFDYEGGKQLIQGVLVGILEVVVGVLAIVGAILSGGALLVVIAGVVGGIIAVANGIANIVNEGRAFGAAQNGDPALGYRLSDLNTVTETMRTESDDSFWHNVATGIDVVNLACTVVSVVSSCGKLLKNGFKWLTGSTASLKDIQLKDVLTKDNLKAFGSKMKLTISTGFTGIKDALRMGNWEFIRGGLLDFGSDFMNNLKGEFLDFGSAGGEFTDNLKDGVSSLKNILSLGKDLVKDGFTIETIGKGILLPCITVADLPVAPGKDYDAITLDDFYGIFDKLNSKVIGSPVFSSDLSIDTSVLEKLSTTCDIRIAVPDIQIPQIAMPAFSAA